MEVKNIKMKKKFLLLHCDATLNFVQTFRGQTEDLDVDILLIEKAIQEYKKELTNGKKDKANKKSQTLGFLLSEFNKKLDLLMKD